MKKLRKVLAVVTALVLAVSMLGMVTVADDVTVVDSGTFGADGSNLSWSLTSDGVLTISGTGAMEDFSNYRYTGILSDVPWSIYKSSYTADVVVTSVVIEEGVTTIGKGAFYYFTSLSSVSLPDTLLEIHEYAFVETALTSVSIPDSVVSIDAASYVYVDETGSALTSGGAFYCESLTSITVSEDNKYYLDVDGVLFNKDGTELIFYPVGRTGASYAIPDGVTTIADGAFFSCKHLQNISVPSSVTNIGVEAFCSEKIKTVTISEDVSGLSIGKEAFMWSYISSIDIPAGVTNIEESAFRACYNLSSINVDGDNQYYCDIDGILFSKDQTVLLAYSGKSSNVSYAIPNSVVHISEYAFDCASYLATLYIPKTVTSIGYYAFGDSLTFGENLTDVYYYGSESEWNSIDVCVLSSCNTGLYYATIHYNYVPEYEITIDETTNGTVVADVETAAAGDTVTLTVTPDDGYEVSSVTVTDEAGNEVTLADDYTFTMPENDVTVTAVFAEVVEDTAIWTVTRDEWADNGNYASFAFTLSDYCDDADEIVSGDNVTINVTVESDGTYFNGTIGVNTPDDTAEEGYSWASAGTIESTASPDVWTYTVDVASDYAQIQLWWIGSDGSYVSVTDISVTINETEPEPTTYAVTIGEVENGTVTADVDTAEAGDTVTLTVTPDEGYVVSSVTVTDADGNEITVADDYSFTMPENSVTISVVFEAEAVEPTTYTVTVGEAENGTVTADVDTAEAGDTVTLTVTPDEGYVVSSVTVTDADGNEITVADDYSFTMPENNVTVAAVFEEEATDEPTDPSETYTVTVTVTVTGGTVTVDKTEAAEGETVTITITLADGYSVTGVTVVDSYGNTITVTLSGSAYTFTMPSSAVTITPTFEEASTEHTHTYVLSGWNWSSDLNSAVGIFYCSSCGGRTVIPATITSSYSNGVPTKIASIYYNGVWYSDSQIDISSLSSTTTTTTPTTTTTTTTTEETITVSDPIEDTNTKTEDEGETVSEPEVSAETNPTTGVALSLVPLAIAALAIVSSKRK
ncbi:MAG: leucine-rich repeat protein [Oscillospiraceae bacterium]|nr:leucine-rich repeat protein [Oscillospiraceae bacterium]